jgi:hypothetical protein
MKAQLREKSTENDSEDNEEVGGRDRVRTCDPLLAKQVLSQLSYTPILTGSRRLVGQ